MTAYSLLPHNWPALVVGVVVAAYWFRVMCMAIKMRRRIGRAANLIPAEPLGRALRLIWQPIVCIWVICPFCTALVPRLPVWAAPIFDSRAVQWVGVAMAIIAYAATRICWKRMGKSWRMGIDPSEKTALVFTGPYAFVRHPIYALSSLLMLATVAVVPSPIMIVAAVLHLLLLQWEARREERHLCRVHGRQYEQYFSQVGRFIPRFRRPYSQSPSVL